MNISKSGKENLKTTKLFREFSSGGVVFKKENGHILWLVTKAAVLPKSFYSSETWRFPKGWIDNKKPTVPGPMASGKVRADEESLQKSALREVAEEAGTEAKIIKKIGVEKFFFNSKIRGGKALKFVTFYLMEWSRDLPEGYDQETAEVKWLSFDEAQKILSFGGEKQVLKKAKEILDKAKELLLTK